LIAARFISRIATIRRACDLVQFAPAGKPTALSNLSEIFADLLSGFIHSRTSKEWQAERLSYNSFVGGNYAS